MVVASAIMWLSMGAEHTAANPAQVLEAARRGDAQAQAKLFELHKRTVAAQIQRMTGDPSVVDDLVQEVFIAAFAALPSFRGEARVSTWLYRIAANKVRNYWDSHNRRVARERAAAKVPVEAPTEPDEHYARDEHRELLYEMLGRLPTKLREAFVSRAIEGMSLVEASEVLGVPVSTVSYRTRRAERLLCEHLGVDFEEASS